MSFSAKMKGRVWFALLAVAMAGPVMAQEPPHPRAALIQCLMTAADPGERVDGICSDLAMDVCGVGRSLEAAEECRAEMACRFVEEAAMVATRSGVEGDFADRVGACGGVEGVACRHGLAREVWIAARAEARAVGTELDVADGEMARCWLD